MTEYQKKNQTIGKDPQVIQVLELSLMGFKNKYSREKRGKKLRKKMGRKKKNFTINGIYKKVLGLPWWCSG